MDNTFGIPVSKSMLGKMKDEFVNDIIVCVYVTGAKAYYIHSLNGEIKKAKGVKKMSEKELSSDYCKKMFEHDGVSSLHNIYTEIKSKIARSHHDKRFIIPNSTKTLSWGHSDITFYQTDPATNIQLATNVLNGLNGFVNDSDKNESDKIESDIELMNGILAALHRKHLSQYLNDRLDTFVSLMMKDLENE